ncbi:N-arachidonyl glycine receptor [Callorhinchus milii]|uniref:N-arachidonyl glycine receptor n=1 Tax=Callorhinchus milii TaxID=7868 RepID=V9KKY6_CALMI|nr:N-arachidonyl glycine receptor [Callorhinchus milii]XP_007904492.1 N-arachidonyl glycine receptor [Callorhinchus milii]|eukprot:gi/632975907/ref/XP_007904491.1/ PREDICTED: N-arachidonyl glycine receptor [Callorhinchus milii]
MLNLNLNLSNLQPQEFRIGATIFYSILFIIGLIVNITAIWVFSCTTKKGTSVNIYMMNVALLDLIFIILLPFRMIYYVNNYWPFGDVFCQINAALTIFYPSIALWLLAFISVDRYMAVVQPKHAKELRHIGKAVASCCGIWIMTSVSVLPFMFSKNNPDKASNFTTCLKMLDIIHLKEANIVNFVRLIFFFLLPLFIMIGCYCIIINSLLKGKTSKLKPKTKEKSIKIIVTLIIQVLFCFVPFHICFTLLLLQGDRYDFNAWAAFTTLLMNLSTCLDIILYYIVSKHFQARVISVIYYRNYLRSVRRKSFRNGSFRSLSKLNISDM